MADERTISAAELLELARDGAKIETEHRPQVIAGFDDLITKINNLIQAMNARTEADLARSKTLMEVIAYLQSQLKQNVIRSQPTDLTPLKTVLAEIQTNTERRPLSGYEFEVTARDRLGDIEKLKVLPISPTAH